MTGAGSVANTGTYGDFVGGQPSSNEHDSRAIRRIVPVETPLKTAGSKFNHSVPPYAIQMLELHTK